MALAGALVLTTGLAEAQISVQLSYTDLNSSTITATFSGTAEITTTTGFDEWNYAEDERFDWRGMTRDSGVNIFGLDSFVLQPNLSVISGDAAATVGGTSVSVTHIDIFSRTSDNRNDFGFSFDADPGFSVGETVAFSGTVDFDLIDGKTAADLELGTWSEPTGQIFWTSQLGANGGLNLTIVPEPSNVAVLSGVAALAFVGLRRNFQKKK